jgi:hypothetical protein
VWAGLTQRTLVATAVLAALFAGFTRVFDGLLPEGAATPPWMLVVTLAVQVSALAFNGWVIWRGLSPAAAHAPDAAAAVAVAEPA